MTEVSFLTVYAAHGDGGERGVGPVIGYFSNDHQARCFAAGKAWYGGDGHVCACDAIKVGEQVFVLNSRYPIDLDKAQAKYDEELRERTLKKLSDEELRVLGLRVAKDGTLEQI